MDYLGLGEDDAYDDYDDHDAVDRSGGVSRTGDPRGGFDDSRPVARQVTPRDTDPVPTPRRPQFDDSSVQPRPISARQGSSVRTLGGSTQGETHTVKAIRFNDIQEVANRFRDGYAVILNTEGCDDEVARRMIDFSSGLCYALHGKIEKVARGVYLLKPDTRSANPEY
ncbi:MAG: hypothetical protein GM46_9980 [actinobacterium acAcidi]|nr:MAG: hypothetical protein GM46_9980 [actinobacterium acAcidi]